MSDINQDTTSAQKLGSTSSGPMPSASPNALAEQIRSAFHEWALFIDLDGTLIEIAAAPDQVQVPPDLGVLLRALELRTGGALAIITGRPVDFVDGLFPEHAFTIAGVHGAEIRFGVALGQEDRASRVQTPSHHRLAKARDFVRDQTLPLRGLLLEDKGVAFALHYRGVPHLEAAVQSIMAEALTLAPEGHVLKAGKMVVELCPDHADKRLAVSRLMEIPPFEGRRAFAAGDDLTDEGMFLAAHETGGVSVHVEGLETRTSRACTRLACPKDFRNWLRELLT